MLTCAVQRFAAATEMEQALILCVVTTKVLLKCCIVNTFLISTAGNSYISSATSHSDVQYIECLSMEYTSLCDEANDM